jgi:hypothetical protein
MRINLNAAKDSESSRIAIKPGYADRPIDNYAFS